MSGQRTKLLPTLKGDQAGSEMLQAMQQAVTAYARGDSAEAERLCRTILEARGNYFDALSLLGVIAAQTRRTEEAADLLGRAVAAKPSDPVAHSNYGNVLKGLKRLDDALESYARALKIKPDYAEAHYNRGNTLQELKRFEEAVDSYARALQSRPGHAAAHYNRGNALHQLKRFDEALESYARALQINPDFGEVYNNRGVTLEELRRFEQAFDSYTRALKANPHCDWLLGAWLHVKMHLCDWGDLDSVVADLAAKIQQARKVASPFPVLAFTDSPSLQRRAAEIWVAERYAASAGVMPAIGKLGRHGKIRVGYFSEDYRDHPVSTLTAELFEMHDRSRFEVLAFSFGPDTQDEMRKRMERAFDRFIDVREKSDLDIVQLARTMELDIAVDLGGFTGGCRPIFAMRAAPLQVSYLGYLGTLGADYMDYLIADPTIIPVDHQKHYAEKIVYLPSYQVNDSKRIISDRGFTREELGLPPTGFVFCCFNASYKITPKTFDCWMRILRQVEGSVLFLYARNLTVRRNLRKEAVARGVAAERLVFGERLPVAEYLARYRTADLFLDTLPYNAGTTASDALWMGLPVLTCMGESFAARLAASLLNALGLPELVTTTHEHCEAMAIELAGNPGRLAEIRERLQRNRSTMPLFDTARFTRRLENAYTQMYERYQADLGPDHIYVTG